MNPIHKKVGIITFHRALSFGAGYQAYALQEYIKIMGYDVEIIDYEPKRFQTKQAVFPVRGKESLWRYIFKCIPSLMMRLLAYKKMQRFNHKYLNQSTESYRTATEVKKANDIYDIFITGSDQVWNLNFDAFEEIKPYLLSFVGVGKKKIAYAASTGTTSFSHSSNSEVNAFLYLLRCYSSISVREDITVQFLAQYKITVSHVLDPTFLLYEQDWRRLAERPKRLIRSGKFVLVYGLYRNRKLYYVAKMLAKEYQLEIVNASDNLDTCKGAYNDYLINHETLLWYLLNAKYVVTDSFHGCALALNFSKPLYIFDSPRNNTRLQSLVRLFDLQDRVVADEKIPPANMNYQKVKKILCNQRQYAKSFLENSLKE